MTVCFTGHRSIQGVYYDPEKLDTNWITTGTRVFEVIHKLLKEGHKTFISGGALGFDQLAAHAVIHHKIHTDNSIELWMALPFPEFERKWPAKSRVLLDNIIGCADKTFYINQGPYSAWKLFARNEWMVDHSSTIVAMYIPNMKGGTKACLDYAVKKLKRRITINPLTGIVEV